MNRRNFENRVLTNEDINRIAPSVFANQPWYAQSERYAFVPTSDIVEGMRSAGFMPYAASQSLSRVEGKQFFTKHQLRFRPENVNLTKIGDTTVESVVTNSHDGSSTYEISLGAFRLACLNGMMVAEGLAQIYRVRHSGNIIQGVIDATQRVIEAAPKVVEQIGQWKAINLTEDDALTLATSAHALRFDEDGPVAPRPVDLLKARRAEDRGTDLWTVFNRIQENVITGGIAPRNEVGTRILNPVTGRRAPKTRAVTGIDQSTKLNRALWSLAENMALLKA